MQVCVDVLGELRGNIIEIFSDNRLASVHSLSRQCIQIVSYDGWSVRNQSLLYEHHDMRIFLTRTDGFTELDV
jgi:hypothetical protein